MEAYCCVGIIKFDTNQICAIEIDLLIIISGYRKSACVLRAKIFMTSTEFMYHAMI